MGVNPPVDVQQLGQSIWLDSISRKLLNSGKLKKYIRKRGVRGVTSNPTIFQEAIAGTRDYDDDIEQMLDQNAHSIYEHLAIQDIQAAADMLKPIYEESNRVDGYACLEVSPLLADDTEATLAEAKRLFAALDQPNTMIKIPATPAGLPAIEEAIYAGLNINVTLLFSVEVYKQVAERYIQGLQRRVKEGKAIDHIASVASFFVSRIDTMVDQQLQNNIRAAQGRDVEKIRTNRELLGTIAIANTKLVYQAFKEIFHSDRFANLQQAGAMIQRPLWASTSTKDPSYPDTLYVDSLIGPQTVSTVPIKTLKAFRRHGTVAETLETDLDLARKHIAQLRNPTVNIDLESITRMLTLDGVDAFADSFEKLLRAIDGKREMLKAGVIKRQRGIVGGYEPGVRRLVEQLDRQKINTAIWQKDASIWKENITLQERIQNRLGWLFCITDGQIDRQRLKNIQAEASEWSHVVVLGMGGSSLAPEVFQMVFGNQEHFPELLVLDSTVPSQIYSVEETIQLHSTLFIVASKSGTTLETDSFRRYFYDKVSEICSPGKAGQQFIAITDEGTPLADIAQEHRYREVFYNPLDIGGRYSALSYFGLVPAALMGIDLERIFDSAERMLQAVSEIIPAQGHPGIWLGTLMGYLAKQGHDKLLLICSQPIAHFALWIEQLVAESTGKDGIGILPVVAPTVGLPHDHDDDRFVVYLRLEGETPELDAQVRALWEAGHPVFTIDIQSPYDLGGEFLRWEFATAVAGYILRVNPFDEPNVSQSKQNTQKLLEYYNKYGELPPNDPYLETKNVDLYVDSHMGEILSKVCEQRNYSDTELAGLLAAHISFARSGDYIAIIAYLEYNAENDNLLKQIQRRLRHSTTRVITLGYGPRYLHSTGQLHKGGPTSGNFIQITVDDAFDLEIPGKPYSFGVLKRAQAMGDQQTLMQREQPFVRLHIKGNIQAGLSKILEAVAIAEEKQI